MATYDNSGQVWIGCKEVSFTPEGGSIVYLADQISVAREYSNTVLTRRAGNQTYPRVSLVTQENKQYTVVLDDVEHVLVDNASSFAVDTQGTLAYSIIGKGDAQNDVHVSVTVTVKEVQLSEANGDDVTTVTIMFEAKYEDGSGDPETITAT